MVLSHYYGLKECAVLIKRRVAHGAMSADPGFVIPHSLNCRKGRRAGMLCLCEASSAKQTRRNAMLATLLHYQEHLGPSRWTRMGISGMRRFPAEVMLSCPTPLEWGVAACADKDATDDGLWDIHDRPLRQLLQQVWGEVVSSQTLAPRGSHLLI